MPVALLTIFKLVLLALLYLFLFRAVRAVTADLYGQRSKRSRPPPRPSVAESSSSRRTRRPPKELVIHPPEGKPRVVTLEGTVTLGRSGRMTVQLEDSYVSDEHAAVESDGDGWAVRDLGSTNGTYLNGAKVTQPTEVGAGDQLRLGKTRIEVRR